MPSLGSFLAKARLIAPEILIAECANILWKKVRGKELSREEALLAARLLQGAALELLPIRSLLETATRIAIELDHPAYDCVYTSPWRMIKPTRLIGEYAPRVLFTAVVPALQQAKKCGYPPRPRTTGLE
jgi:hypothetical protein